MVTGTDSSGGEVTPIGREIELMHAAGLSPLDAIRTTTVDAARLLGVSGSVGRLAPGCAGDVLVVDSDPLSDVSALSRPVGVVRAGRIC
ncbi:hypothetical protein GCM10010216_37300 [Streptomyces flaveolus]|nr:hypothetical protein GCM10010216_37300 [Streptomyces flaveolus]